MKTAHATKLTLYAALLGNLLVAVTKFLAAAVSGRWAPETIRKDLLRASEVL